MSERWLKGGSEPKRDRERKRDRGRRRNPFGALSQPRVPNKKIEREYDQQAAAIMPVQPSSAMRIN